MLRVRARVRATAPIKSGILDRKVAGSSPNNAYIFFFGVRNHQGAVVDLT